MSAPARSGAQELARRMAARGVERLFLYPGGTIAPTLHAWIELGRPYVVSRHEQGAGYAALAQGRLGGAPGVAMVTSGPGVTNILTVVADAWYDSTPLVVICGQVGSADLAARPAVRQRGFQEVPTPQLVGPIAKACLRPLHPDEVGPCFEQAWLRAQEGRPGPVVIDLPMDAQRGALGREAAKPEPAEEEPVPARARLPDPAQLDTLAEWLAASRRPVLLAGQGVLQSGATAALRALAERLQAPVATSLLGVGALPGEHALCLGYLGHTGTGWANRAVARCDLLLALGARLDVRQTGTRTAEFVREGRVVRVDVDAAELAQGRVRADLALHADAGRTLEGLLARLPAGAAPRSAPWLAEIEASKRSLPLDDYAAGEGCHPARLLQELERATRGRPAVVVTGVGHHQQWAARHLRFDAPQRVLLTSGGHGAMGYDLPSAVGAAFARPGTLVLCVVGDGSFQMNLQELGTIAEYGLPVKILVLDNRRLAMVSQFQNLTWSRDPSTGGRAAFDFSGFAALYGIPAWRAEREGPQLGALLRRFLDEPGPALLHARIDPACDVVPMLLAGQALDAMWPWHTP